jgi:hypothetical protein
MQIFTKRNALLGWIVYRVARRRLEQKAEAVTGHRRRRGLLAGLGLAAGAAAAAAAVALWARRGHTEPAHAGA